MVKPGEEQQRGSEQADACPCVADVTSASQVIAIAGEALVDFVLEPDGRATPHLGGGSFNTARTIGRLGLQPVFIGRLSEDRYGRALRHGLEQSGVRLDGVVPTHDPTTFARVEVDGEGMLRRRFYLERTSSAGLMPDEARDVMPPAPAALHVGGLGLMIEPQATAIATLVREANPETLVLVDPSCRDEAIGDPVAYRKLLGDLLARADVVKASEDDLAYLEPRRTPLQTARSLLERGPLVVLLTRGSRGVAILTTGGETIVSAPEADVIDTTGASDAFGGAWLAAWVADGSGRAKLRDFVAVVRTARFAATVAARTCERAGAEPPYGAKVGAEWCLT